MNTILGAALAARATFIAPIHRAKLRQLAAARRAPISVLFYHRVSDRPLNDWTIGRDSFRRQIDYCREHLELIDLAEVQRRVAGNHSPSPAVSITFDDGYADNCEFAIPLMIELGIPCTYFVTTSHVRDQIPFPHDAAVGKPLPVNTVRQIREAADAGIEIGCHTRTHVDFSKVSHKQILRAEIIDAKDELEQMIGKPVRYFAFPFGMPAQLTEDAIAVVQEAGFAGFCSAYGAYNLPGRDAFHIRRCHGDPEFSRFINWLSFDPNKLRKEPSIAYRLPQAETASSAERDGLPQQLAFAPAIPKTISRGTEACG